MVLCTVLENPQENAKIRPSPKFPVLLDHMHHQIRPFLIHSEFLLLHYSYVLNNLDLYI